MLSFCLSVLHSQINFSLHNQYKIHCKDDFTWSEAAHSHAGVKHVDERKVYVYCLEVIPYPRQCTLPTTWLTGSPTQNNNDKMLGSFVILGTHSSTWYRRVSQWDVLSHMLFTLLDSCYLPRFPKHRFFLYCWQHCGWPLRKHFMNCLSVASCYSTCLKLQFMLHLFSGQTRRSCPSMFHLHIQKLHPIGCNT